MKKIKTYVIFISLTFPAYHSRKGDHTYFIEKLLGRQTICEAPVCVKKLHTFRGNYKIWKKRIDEVLAGNAIISIRYHTLGRYVKGNEQIEVAQFNNNSFIGIQEAIYLPDFKNDFRGMAIRCDDGLFYDFPFYKVAENDGLRLSDFMEWFEKGKYNLKEPMACIHFTSFRYKPYLKKLIE
ncbi:MAG: hypothetical protein PHH37_08415 [Paludibacter sp.]|nr:hypothetical protein [Paludibacter sp.]